MKTTIYVLVGFLFSNSCYAQNAFLRYFSQTVPSDTPKVFLKGVSERIGVSNDFKEIYFNDSDGVGCYKYFQDKWNGPFKLFKGFQSPSLSPDNKTLFLQDPAVEAWYSRRQGDGWSVPVKFWNSPSTKHYLQQTDSGNYYLTCDLTGPVHGTISKLVIAGGDTSARSLGVQINSSDNGLDFFVSRDESYIIFVQHPGGVNGDLFICFRKKDGMWTSPKNLGPLINSTSWEWGPYVTPDNKYLFFTRASSASEVQTYWVRFDALLDKLRSEER